MLVKKEDKDLTCLVEWDDYNHVWTMFFGELKRKHTYRAWENLIDRRVVTHLIQHKEKYFAPLPVQLARQQGRN